MRTPAPMWGIGPWWWRGARCGWYRCASGPSRSGCWRLPDVTFAPGTLDALGGVAAIAIERVQLLDARQAGELTRQSDELKTALLASLGHDLRTPLTAIRIAASNLQGPSLEEAERREQSDLILARGGAPHPAVPEHPRDGPHRCGRGRHRGAMGAPVGDYRRGARSGGAYAARPPAAGDHRSGRYRSASTPG